MATRSSASADFGVGRRSKRQRRPESQRHERRQPLEIHQLLPKTNCKACGESTCFSYALKLAAGQVEPGQCTPLIEEEAYEQQKGELEALLEAKWPTL